VGTVNAGRRAKPLPPDPTPPTRQAILDVAERMFSARGIDGVAVRDLARELNLTPSSLYNHFPGKQALYEAVLERGLRPIVAIVAEAWAPGGLRQNQVGDTIERLLAHLVAHPHLGRLLQRALIEEGGSGQDLIAHWLGPLYEQGVAVTRRAALAAGWDAQEIPHLTLGLFGMVFAYFTNAPAVRRFAGWQEETFSTRSLGVQRRFLEEAVYRLLGPRQRERPRKARDRQTRRRHG
jgi:TetR/AcrR family transcriptional regulator